MILSLGGTFVVETVLRAVLLSGCSVVALIGNVLLFFSVVGIILVVETLLKTVLFGGAPVVVLLGMLSFRCSWVVVIVLVVLMVALLVIEPRVLTLTIVMEEPGLF